MTATRGRPPTMADVAALAKVSHQTVSRVLNDMPGVHPDTARRVRAAIGELGYRRNQSARLLASRRSGLIGVATWALNQFGPQQVLLGLEGAAREAGYGLWLRSIRELTEESVEAAVEELLGIGVEAIVLVVPHETVSRFAQAADLGVPTLVLEGDLSRSALTANVDNVLGARLAVRHLLELGHETVVHVAGPPGWSEASARVEGWRLELEEWGRQVPPLRWGGDWSSGSGYDAGVTLAREPEITAVFAANDQMALGLIAALTEAGRRVPDDVSVVGFDDLPESSYFQPPLTTVRQDFDEVGRRAMRLVARALAGEERPVEDQVVPVLVPRRSSAVRSAT